MTDFYDTYLSFEKDELFKLVLFPDEYQPDAILAAKQVIREKNWTSDLNKKLEEQKKIDQQKQELYEEEIKEKAAYYKDVVEFKNQGNSFQVRIADIPRFEAVLSEKGIDFFREDKNIGVQLDSYPTQTYFFKNEDTEVVDNITKELGLITAPYADLKPFFRFEVKVALIVIIVAFLLIIIFK